MEKKLHIIGAGMAGCEAAWHAANRDLKVVIHEMRPKVKTFAHQTDDVAELVFLCFAHLLYTFIFCTEYSFSISFPVTRKGRS